MSNRQVKLREFELEINKTLEHFYNSCYIISTSYFSYLQGPLAVFWVKRKRRVLYPAILFYTLLNIKLLNLKITISRRLNFLVLRTFPGDFLLRLDDSRGER